MNVVELERKRKEFDFLYLCVHRMNVNVLEHRTVEMSSLDGQLVGEHEARLRGTIRVSGRI